MAARCEIRKRHRAGEYLVTLGQLSDKIDRLDKRIEEFSRLDEYAEKVNKLVCFKGIKTHTAMSLIVETSDFKRFPSAPQYAAFLGLFPGEHSSSDSCSRLPITEAGNSHLRRLLIEAENSYGRVRVGRKCAGLKQQQQGNRPEGIVILSIPLYRFYSRTFKRRDSEHRDNAVS